MKSHSFLNSLSRADLDRIPDIALNRGLCSSPCKLKEMFRNLKRRLGGVRDNSLQRLAIRRPESPKKNTRNKSSDLSCLDGKIQTQHNFDYFKNELLMTIGSLEIEPVFALPLDMNVLKTQLGELDLILKPKDINLFMISQDILSTGFFVAQVRKTEWKKQLGGPSRRKEVELLSQWLNTMLKNAINSNREEIYENAQLIYSACFKELVRQVSVQCRERGELLHRVFSAYFSLLAKAVQEYQERILSFDAETAQLKESLKQQYKGKSQKSSEDVEEYKTKVCELTQKLEALHSVLSFTQSRNHSLKEKLNKVKSKARESIYKAKTSQSELAAIVFVNVSTNTESAVSMSFQASSEVLIPPMASPTTSTVELKENHNL